MTEKLKPCPFCGSKADLYDVHGFYFVKCKNPRCGVQLQAFSVAEVTRMWNTRTNNTKNTSRKAYSTKNTRIKDLKHT